MTNDVQQKLFEPFFTTKAVGKGTGMGLAICYQIIVEKHKGTIEVNSALNKGTEFCLTLPV
jgi:signal transduction histidine kinase